MILSPTTPKHFKVRKALLKYYSCLVRMGDKAKSTMYMYMFVLAASVRLKLDFLNNWEKGL